VQTAIAAGYIAALAKIRWAAGLQAAYLGRNLAAELLLAKNYANKMITARESK
jgi:hypothetical protein